MTPTEFYNTYLGKVIDDDGAFGAQCVDGFRVFCKWIGISAYPTPNGWADGYWYGRAAHAAVFDSVPVGNFQNGDWVIWARGSASHPSSHIAMFYNGQSFGENQGGNRGFNLKSTKFSDALGALRWKGWESMTEELKEGLQAVSYNGINFQVVMAPEGFGMHVISASQSGVEPYRAVADIKAIDSDKLLVKGKVNAGYFDMSSDASVKGQHYGVEYSETLALLPHQAGYQVFYEKTDGTVGHCTADKFYMNRSDVYFAITPYSVRIANGVQVNDMTTAYGDKDNILNSQTVVFRLKSGRWCLAVTATGQKCYPRDIVAMAAACGAVELAVMDSGGSTQMVVDGQSVVYSGRWIANVMAIAEWIGSTPVTPATPTTDDKDTQIAALQKQVADQKAQIATLLTQVNTLTEKAKKAISDLS